MGSKINKLSMKEILAKVGFPLTRNEFRNTYKYNVNLEIAMEFEKKLKQIKSIHEIEKIICEYEEIFDKEIYVFHIARLLEQDIESIKVAVLLEKDDVNQRVFTNDESGSNKRRFFVNAKTLLKDCDVIDIVMKKSKGDFEIYFSKDFVNQNSSFTDKRRKIAEEKLEKIDKKIGLKNVLAHLRNADLSEICRYPNLAILLIVNQEKLEKKIRKYIEYIDVDKMLVLSNAIYYYKHGENLSDFSENDAKILKRFTKNVAEIVGTSIKTLESTRFDFVIDFNELKEKANKLVEGDEEELEDSEPEIEIKAEESIEKLTEELEEEQAEEITEEQVEEIAEESTETQIEEQIEEQVEVKTKEQDNEETETQVEEIEENNDVENASCDEKINKTGHEMIDKLMHSENKSIISPEHRKNLISKLDNEYNQEDLNDGTTIFYLPNKECYIIEKMQTENKNSVYGNATYIIDKKVFEKQKDKIINDGNLNQKVLTNLKHSKTKGVTKLVHTGWENAISTFFNMESPNEYTDDEKENIKNLVDKLKK